MTKIGHVSELFQLGEIKLELNSIFLSVSRSMFSTQKEKTLLECELINIICTKVLFARDSHQQKLIPVAWDKVCRLKHGEGLDISSIYPCSYYGFLG